MLAVPFFILQLGAAPKDSAGGSKYPPAELAVYLNANYLDPNSCWTMASNS
jgi:hypothetical protein